MKIFLHLIKPFFFIVPLCIFLISTQGLAQPDTNFDVSFIVDYSAAEQLVDYFDWRGANPEAVAALPGNRLAAATSILLARTNRPDGDFLQSLKNFHNGSQYNNDIYGLMAVKKHIGELRKLLAEAKKHRLDSRVVATLSAYFPADTKISASFHVYVVAMGNEKTEAFVRRVVWHSSEPVFVGENDGEPVIIVNLLRVLETEPAVQGQYLEMLSTLAHECFHATYSVLKQSLPDSTKPHTPSEYLLDIVQNEGIAYYLSMEIHRVGRPLSQEWFTETSQSLDNLNKALNELNSSKLTPSRTQELLMDANLSGSFMGNYGATAGMRMAYEIDTKLGRQALTETLLHGFASFVESYQKACRRR
ncbi:MAG: DUF5700 domain-containing putative Zn-dependent protease [Bacteroidota bacterium]